MKLTLLLVSLSFLAISCSKPLTTWEPVPTVSGIRANLMWIVADHARPCVPPVLMESGIKTKPLLIAEVPAIPAIPGYVQKWMVKSGIRDHEMLSCRLPEHFEFMVQVRCKALRCSIQGPLRWAQLRRGYPSEVNIVIPMGHFSSLPQALFKFTFLILRSGKSREFSVSRQWRMPER